MYIIIYLKLPILDENDENSNKIPWLGFFTNPASLTWYLFYFNIVYYVILRVIGDFINLLLIYHHI